MIPKYSMLKRRGQMRIGKTPVYETVKRLVRKTHGDWVHYFNNKNTKMISAPDVYKVAKEKNKAILNILKRDFNRGQIFINTQVKYNKGDLIAEIVHDTKSDIVKPKKYKVKIPVLEGDFKYDSKTEKYLQALFDTKDSLNIILKVLKRFGQQRKLRFWTPVLKSRNPKQTYDVVVYFTDDDDWFDVSDYLYNGALGRSHGIIYKKNKKVRGKAK